MQVRVPGTPASGCTKDFRRKCTGAGEVAKVAKTNNAVWRGEARTYLHQTSTEESLDRGGHLDSLAGFMGPRSSSLPAQSAVDFLAEGEEGDAEEL
ncbi:hypothetical protein NDU88_003447 [Pleurodeles waltl]|uniref:Uncharacterized protein n=1 Tax=Pleurodeles waltl TaxID=8319 RepID=A0AAV7P9N3_PLEWA|nr:hypothetical protein NDU88_003446 [Pleurodeles waltl]KAJ1125007.1 hypothetical protein NDU88_003447 [Pleurodeles waltl]